MMWKPRGIGDPVLREHCLSSSCSSKCPQGRPRACLDAPLIALLPAWRAFVCLRMAVLFRDAREVVISEHRMRFTVYHRQVGALEPYIRGRFEVSAPLSRARTTSSTSLLSGCPDIYSTKYILLRKAFLGFRMCTEEEIDPLSR